MNWLQLIDFKRSFTESVPKRTENALIKAGIDIYTASPRFISDLTLEVNDQTLRADKIHIAVGAKPAKLSIEGFDHMITSDDFLELDELPKRIIFVGGGYISFELAHIASRFGADVTILHSDDKPLSMFDSDMVKELLKASKEVGVKIVLNSSVSKITKSNKVFSLNSGLSEPFTSIESGINFLKYSPSSFCLIQIIKFSVELFTISTTFSNLSIFVSLNS